MAAGSFEEFVAKKDAARAAAPIRVTWRKVSLDTGGGWSGIGPAGPALVARVKRSDERQKVGRGPAVYVYTFWLVREGTTLPYSTRQINGGTLVAAKKAAAEMLQKETRS